MKTRLAWLWVAFSAGWVTFCPAADLRDGLVAYYQFEGDLKDASGEGHDAHPSGGGAMSFLEGLLGQAVDTRQTAVDCGTWDPSDEKTHAFSASCWVYWLGVEGAAARWQGILAKRTGWGAGLSRWQLELGDGSATAYLVNQPNGGSGSVTLVKDEWQHVGITYDGSNATVYRNGTRTGGGAWTLDNDKDAPLSIGMSQPTNGNKLNGYVDEVAFWNRGLSADEIAAVYNSGQGYSITGRPVTATRPIPDSGTSDVPKDTALSWTPSPSATTRDVYFGTVQADVNDASAGSPLGVLVSKGQAGTTFPPAGPLAFGQTYYWRVDEINAPPDSTVFKGGLWSFTTEPYSYPIKPTKATASSSFAASMGPDKTIDGSGLNAMDQHGTSSSQMWLSKKGQSPIWIQYEFDGVYKLHQMWVWNSNQPVEAISGFGAKDVTIETSQDGTTWTAQPNVPEFAQGTGEPNYVHNTTVDFGAALARFVKLTIATNWADGTKQAGLSEVRFFYVPVRARLPQPAAGATGVAIDGALNWRPGREAATHEVLLSADQAAVVNGTVQAKTVAAHSLDLGPLALEYGRTYYWKVNEVNDAATPKVWPGDVWSFTTIDYAVVDDFEKYDDACSRIFFAWVDGFGYSASTECGIAASAGNATGSTVGNVNPPFAEKTITHSGGKSMPMWFDNTKAPFTSETQREWATAQTWTGGGANTLTVWLRGEAPGFLESAGGGVIMNGTGTDIWNTSDELRFAYKALKGNGSITAKVDSVANTNGWAKAGVMIRESVDPGASHAVVVVTPANSVSFQRREVTAGTSSSTDVAGGLKAPYWVRVTRTGNTFTGQRSPDGVVWTDIPVTPALTLAMANDVLIGLAVTSHAAGAVCGARFSNVSTTGTVSGQWQVAEVGTPQVSGNVPETLYVALQDAAGKTTVVAHPDPTVIATGSWEQWTLPLSQFVSGGVNLSSVKKITIGVGNRSAPKAGGSGKLYIDDVRLTRLAAP